MKSRAKRRSCAKLLVHADKVPSIQSEFREADRSSENGQPFWLPVLGRRVCVPDGGSLLATGNKARHVTRYPFG